MKQLKDILKTRNERNKELWLAQTSTMATARTLQDSLLSQRWRDRRFSWELYEALLAAEEEAYKQKKTKYVTMNSLTKDNDLQEVERHGSVFEHIFYLKELRERYPPKKSKEFIRKLDIAIQIHDLGEVWYLDRSQSEGKNEVTRAAEDQELQTILARLYTWASLEETKDIIEELDTKSELYISLKIYEEISHIDGVRAMEAQWIQVHPWMRQNHINNLKKYVEKDSSYNSVVKKFLSDFKAKNS